MIACKSISVSNIDRSDAGESIRFVEAKLKRAVYAGLGHEWPQTIGRKPDYQAIPTLCYDLSRTPLVEAFEFRRRNSQV